MSNTLLRHTLIKNIFDIFVDTLSLYIVWSISSLIAPFDPSLPSLLRLIHLFPHCYVWSISSLIAPFGPSLPSLLRLIHHQTEQWGKRWIKRSNEGRDGSNEDYMFRPYPTLHAFSVTVKTRRPILSISSLDQTEQWGKRWIKRSNEGRDG
jgi:hypothetical protein